MATAKKNKKTTKKTSKKTNGKVVKLQTAKAPTPKEVEPPKAAPEPEAAAPQEAAAPPKTAPEPILSHTLTTEEVLKFKNVALQRQFFNSEMEKLTLQEELIAREVSGRVGNNVTGWQYDLINGRVIHPQKLQQMNEAAKIQNQIQQQQVDAARQRAQNIRQQGN